MQYVPNFTHAKRINKWKLSKTPYRQHMSTVEGVWLKLRRSFTNHRGGSSTSTLLWTPRFCSAATADAQTSWFLIADVVQSWNAFLHPPRHLCQVHQRWVWKCEHFLACSWSRAHISQQTWSFDTETIHQQFTVITARPPVGPSYPSTSILPKWQLYSLLPGSSSAGQWDGAASLCLDREGKQKGYIWLIN